MRTALLTASLVVLTAYAAAEPSIKAYANRTAVAKNSSFVLTVELSGTEIGDIVMPEMDGINVNGAPRSTESSMQFQMVNGRVTSSYTQQFRYMCQATRAGKLTIPPLSVTIDGQTLTTSPIVITVSEEGAAPPAEPAQPAGGNPGAPRDPTWDDVAFIEMNVNKREAYLGEPIQLTLDFGRLALGRVQVSPQNKLSYPAAEGFYVSPSDQRREQRDRNGFSYEVTQFLLALYPTRTGELRIDEWQVEVAAGYGFNWQNVMLTAPSITVNVLDLPERPANFSGAVGAFTVQAAFSDDEVIQGTPVRLTVTVSGRGNPDAVGAPVLPKLPNTHVSDPENEVKPLAAQGPLAMEKTFVYSVTPLEPGPLDVPPIEFCYFEPDAKEYRTIKAGPFKLNVLKSAESGARTMVTGTPAPSAQGAVDIVGDDILASIAEPGRLHPHSAAAGMAPVVAVAPVAAYTALALYLRRRRRFERDTVYARGYYARSKTDKRLRTVLQSPQPTEALFKAVSDYIADKLNATAGGMTSGDARQALEARGVSADVVETFVRILRACERAQYASQGLSPDEASALVEAALVAVDKLEQELKKRPAVSGRASS